MLPTPSVSTRLGSVIGGFAVMMLASTLWSLPAQGTEFFHSPSDDGQPASGAATIPDAGTQSVFLWVDGGASASAPGAACHDGAGDEVCGYSITLTGIGGLSFVSFSADGSADVAINQSPGTLILNGLDPVAPGAGPQRIGVVSVASATGGSVELTAGEVIGADLGSESIATHTLVEAPEPTMSALFMAGLATLVAFTKGRARR